MQTVADRIKQARQSAGLSQDALARKLGVAKNTVSRWEGGRVPSGQSLSDLAKALGVTTDWLLHGAQESAADRERPDPPHWAEFLANYPRLDELSEEDLDGIKNFAARQGSRVRDWYGWAEIAEWVRRAKPWDEGEA